MPSPSHSSFAGALRTRSRRRGGPSGAPCSAWSGWPGTHPYSRGAGLSKPNWPTGSVVGHSRSTDESSWPHSRYAEALESIPLTLAESCGLNLLDSILEIRSAHARGVTWFGVDVENRRLADMQGKGVLDIIDIKSQVMKAAMDVVMTMIRVDDVFTQPRWTPPRKPPGPVAHRITPEVRVPGFHYGEARQFLPETW